MATIIQLDSAINDTSNSLPRLPLSLEMIETTGTLLQFDSATALGSVSLPNSGSLLINSSWQKAQKILTTETQNSLSLTFNYTSTPSKSLVEKTTKGGIHGIISTSTISLGDGFQLVVPTAIKQYILNNTSNSFVAYMIGVCTRTGSTTDGLFACAQDSLNNVFKIARNIGTSSNNFPPTSPNRQDILFNPNQDLVTGNTFGRGIAFTGKTGNPVLANTNFMAKAGAFTGSQFNTTTGQGSYILYYLYLEDLTVSGRNKTEVLKLLDAYYQQNVIASTGKYYGDTYTAPSTLP